MRAASDDDLEVLQARLVEAYVASADSSKVDGILSSQLPDGSFADIDYASRSRTQWPPLRHLRRLRLLAAAYREPGGFHERSPAVLAAVDQGLALWYERAPRSENWWHNEIGKQRELGPIGILLEGALSRERLRKMITDLAAAPRLTAQNRVWISEEVIQRGCLENSAQRVRAGFAGMTDTLTVTTSEGVQPDHSFHQHGPRLYSGGYGASFLADSTRWAWLARGTSYAFAPEKIDVLVRLALDGDRWMIRGRMFDVSATGRQISRPGQNARFMKAAAARLARLAPTRATEFRALKAYVVGARGPVVTGNRHFWRSDFMAHQQPNMYVSVKMCSDRTVGTESINGENLLGYWLPYGLTTIAPRGDEYQDIYPVWDWSRLPGVTSPRFAARPDGRHRSSFVGGVSDGESGVAAMQLDKADTTAKKAWFVLGDTMVALGADIDSRHVEAVGTTLDQRLAHGGAVSSAGPIARGESMLRQTRWLHHDDIGYLFFSPTSVHVKLGPATGSWRSISVTQDPAPVKKDVFLAFLDHGRTPVDASYAYAVVPAATPATLRKISAEPAVHVLANSPDVQAVRHDGLDVTGIVFHTPTRLHSGRYELSVDQPALLLFDARRARLTAASPDATPRTLDVTLTPDGGPPERVVITLPSGPEFAGSSVTVRSQRAGSSGGTASLGVPRSPVPLKTFRRNEVDDP